MIDKEQYVIIGTAEDIFAVPVARVQEILEMRFISRLPQSPQNVLGLIEVRSESVVVFDLRRTLGLDPAEDTENTRIVVLVINGETDPVVIGLRADSVRDVVVLDDEIADAAPTSRLPIRTDCIAGIGRIGGQFAIILNLDRLLGGKLENAAA
ncbi:chemotaxis protein CheW [Devosia sp.]|uniref:chemotaxis protein CheW n=1 Tax=Devosia sp. TaxID=1871048 RepID=UPI001AC7519C|nr:chemotaxis protein CheW [Devosia sp.]MBN9334258.1 chemotaxis protein CheW [Devosia sp.]